MVSARPPCRIRCLNTSRVHSNYSTVVSHDTTVFLLTKKFLRPCRGAGQILPLSAALPSSDRFIPHLAFCLQSKCCNCCPCGKEGGGDFLHEGESFGPSPWTQTESACRVTVLPSSACTVLCAAICKTRAMAVSSSSIIGGLFCHGQCDRREEAAHDGLRRVGHDLVVGVHGLLGVLSIVCDLAAVDDFYFVAESPALISSTAMSTAFCATSP